MKIPIILKKDKFIPVLTTDDLAKQTCPTCGAECEVYSRVVGYLRPVDQWNEGKQAEFIIRKTF